MEIAIDIVVELNRQAWISAGIIEPRGTKIGEAVVIHNEVDMQVDPGPVHRIGQHLDTGLGSVKGWSARLAAVKAIIDIVANGLVPGVPTTGRGRPDRPVTGQENIRHTVFHGVIGGLEPLQDGSCGDIREQPPVFELFEHQRPAS